MRTVALDVETNSLTFPMKLWCVVAIDVDTKERFVFDESNNFSGLLEAAKDWTYVVGHNIIGFDYWVLDHFFPGIISPEQCIDTLVLSKLYCFKLPGGHSLGNWGRLLRCPKLEFNEFHEYTPEMLEYCIQDVEVTIKLYHYLNDYRTKYPKAVECEHTMHWICEDMSRNGFKFDIDKAKEIYREIESELDQLDKIIQETFPPRSKLIREIEPKLTKQGTLHKKDFKWYDGTDYTIFSPGSAFSLVEFERFNPASPQQVIERLNEAGWQPIEKTDGHKQAEKDRDKKKLEKYKTYGWKINERNLSTLPDTAPLGARVLVKWLVYASRLRKLDEWFKSYNPDTGRIHGRFTSVGTWPHRMSHQAPNMGNISAAKSIKYNTAELRDIAIDLGGRMRSLWTTDGWLVGTDMAGAHLRLFAHLIRDDKFIQALVTGDSKQGTDAHTMNMKALGPKCPDRDRAKAFIFTWMNGGGPGKVAEILNCTLAEAKEALDNFVNAYPGLVELKTKTIPEDALKGYFIALDGRPIICDSEHLMMAAYLQSGEAIVMKHANILWRKWADEAGIWYRQVNFVHDEFQTECKTKEDAEAIAELQCRAIEQVGKDLGIVCPLAGESSVGKNWHETH